MSLYDQLLDPSNAALLGMSAGLLQAGGPSPYKTGFGPVLGAGITSGMQAGTQARDAQLKQGLLAEQLKRAIAQGKMLDLLQQQYGGQGLAGGGGAMATPQQPAVPSLATAALTMGAGQGSVGPTMQNAALMSQMPQQPAQMPQPAPQMQSPSYFNPENLFMEGRLGMLAGLPGAEGLMNTALSHDPRIAGNVAMAQKGFQAAPGGGVGLVPGFAQGQGQIAGAEAGARFPYEATISTLRNAGRPTVLSPGQQAVSGFSMLPQFLQNAVTGGMGGAGPAGMAPGQPGAPQPPMPTASGLSPLVAESGRMHAAELEKQYGTWQTEANSAQQDNLLIDRMRQESQGFSPGKLAESYGNIQAYLARVPGMDTPERKSMLADYQAFQKNATQLSTSAARTMGAREPGSVIAMFKNAYPNAELTSNAMNAMFTQIQGLNDYKSAKQAGADAWRGSHQGTLEGFQSQWNKTADPMFFVVQRMPPEVRQQFFGKMSPTERQSFGMKYQGAITAGFLQPAQ